MKIKDLIDIALNEDLNIKKDITTRSIFSNNATSKGTILAKDKGIISGIQIVKDVFHQLDNTIKIDFMLKDGDIVEHGVNIVKIEGKTIAILEGERVAINFFSHLSGISTIVRQFVNAVKGSNAKILDTRKTTPGLRKLEKYAVTVGGGINHRMGLYDKILIKDNHIKAAGGITNAVNKVREVYGNIFIEVETAELKEVEEALRCSVSQILLDNMSISKLKESVKLVSGTIPLEASGNVNLNNVREIALTGVQYISVGSVTQSAKTLDMSMKIN